MSARYTGQVTRELQGGFVRVRFDESGNEYVMPADTLIKLSASSGAGVQQMASFKAGDEIEFRNAKGIYRATVLGAQGTGGASPDEYPAKVLSGPDMTGWIVHVPARLITNKMSALGGAGATMNPEMLNKMGLAADCAPSDKMAKFAAYAMEASDDELKAMAADLDGMEGDEPKKMAARMRKMAGEMPPQVQMDVDPGNLPQNAAIHLKTGNVHDEGGRKAGALSAMGAPPFAGKETPEEEKAEAQAMAALAASVKAPAGASRAQVFAMAALASRSPDPAAVDALVEKKLQEREAKQAEAQRKSDMADLMKFARDGGAKDEDIKLLDIIAASDLASARAYLQRIVPGAATGAPPYLFGRMTAAGGPIGAAGAGSPRDIAAARRPKVRNAGAALVYVEDDEYGAEIERIAFSAVPADKAAVDAHIVGSDEQKADKVQRLLAARKVVDAQRPDLAEAITMARIGR